MVRKHEVFWTLEHQNDAKTITIPVATYARFTEAFKDGQALEGNGWHPRYTRHSLPIN